MNYLKPTLSSSQVTFIFSGVKRICDLVVNILERIGLYAQGKTEDLIGVFCTYLKNNKDSKLGSFV